MTPLLSSQVAQPNEMKTMKRPHRKGRALRSAVAAAIGGSRWRPFDAIAREAEGTPTAVSAVLSSLVRRQRAECRNAGGLQYRAKGGV